MHVTPTRQFPPLAQSLGSAERSMRALLDQHLRAASVSFPEWTALVFTSTAAITLQQVARRQVDGHVVASAVETQRVINRMVASGLLSFDGADVLLHTVSGAALFQGLSAKVKDTAQSIFSSLPPSDLEATHRTLLEISRRATALLAQGGLSGNR